MDNVDELFIFYNAKYPDFVDLREVFNQNGKDAEKAYRAMLIDYYNEFYPETPLENTELTKNEMRKDRQKIWFKINKAKEVKETTKGDKEFKELVKGKTQTQINALITKYKTKEEIADHLKIEELLEKYNSISIQKNFSRLLSSLMERCNRHRIT